MSHHWDLTEKHHRVHYFYPDTLDKVLKRVRKFAQNVDFVQDVNLNPAFIDDGVYWSATVVYGGN